MLVVQGGEWANRRALTECVGVTDEFRLDYKSGPVSHFKPAANVRLVLNAIGIIFTAAVFSKPEGLPFTDRKHIDLSLETGAVAHRSCGFRSFSGDRSEIHEFWAKFRHEPFEEGLC